MIFFDETKRGVYSFFHLFERMFSKVIILFFIECLMSATFAFARSMKSIKYIVE